LNISFRPGFAPIPAYSASLAANDQKHTADHDRPHASLYDKLSLPMRAIRPEGKTDPAGTLAEVFEIRISKSENRGSEQSEGQRASNRTVPLRMKLAYRQV
jgi:hypothetical protein